MIIEFNPETLKEKIDKGETKVEQRVPGEISASNCETIIRALAKKKGLENNLDTVMALITGVAQNGGTNRSSNANISFTIDTYTVTAQDIKSTIKDVEKKATFRQFCRRMSSEIHSFAEVMKLDGDLARQMRDEHPDLTQEEAIWCSNYNGNNEKCPPRVRTWLNKNSKLRFGEPETKK